MEVQLIINGIDMTHFLLQPGGDNSDARYYWSVQRNCFTEDMFSFSLDFGRGVSPDNFRLGEVWLQAAGNDDSLEDAYYYSGSRSGSPDTILASPGYDLNQPQRKVRLFGGVITAVELADEGEGQRPYPVLEFIASGYNWRFHKTVMYSNPGTTIWSFENDVNIILHPAYGLELAGSKVYTPNLEGSAPPILDWYKWRPIRSLASSPNVMDLRDGGPGNLDMISRATKVGLKRGWNAIGGPTTNANLPDVANISHQFSGIPYLNGTRLGVITPSPKSGGKMLTDLALRAGAVWWISPYGELNYTRPQEWEPFTITGQKGVQRNIDLHRLATISVLLNIGTYDYTKSAVHFKFVEVAGGLINSLLGNQSIQPVIGFNSNVVRTTAGGGPVIVQLFAGTAPQISPRPINRGPVYYEDSTSTFTVSDRFVDGEYVSLYPGQATVFSPQRSLLLSHDTNIQPNTGIFIEPIHANLAATPWEAFNKVAEVLHDGADLEKIELYNTDDDWANILGRAINFNSPFLNIKDGLSTASGKASTVKLQDLKDNYLDRNFTDIPVVDMGIPSRNDNAEYILIYVVHNLHIEIGSIPIDTGEGEENTLLDILFGGSFLRILLPAIRFTQGLGRKEGKFEYDRINLKSQSLTRFIISNEEYVRRKNEVIQYLYDLRTIWFGQNSTTKKRAPFNNDLIDLIDNEDSPSASALLSLSMAIWHQLDNQAVSDDDLAFDEALRSAAGISSQLSEHRTLSRYVAAYGFNRDDEGYYCKALRISPLGPNLQRYDAQLYRIPPQIQEGIDRAAEALAKITEEVVENVNAQTRGAAPTAVPTAVPNIEETIDETIKKTNRFRQILGYILPPQWLD